MPPGTWPGADWTWTVGTGLEFTLSLLIYWSTLGTQFLGHKHVGQTWIALNCDPYPVDSTLCQMAPLCLDGPNPECIEMLCKETT